MGYADFVEAQLTELLTQYGPVGLIWFDHTHPEIPCERLRRIIATIKRLQPGCLVNNRGVRFSDPFIGDFITPERMIPDSTDANQEFIECCDAMGVKSWGYHAQEVFWSTSELAQRVSRCRSKGYNYLLNVEPAPDGSIREECKTRARALGQWIESNRQAVDAGRCALVPVDPNLYETPLGVATLAGNTLYLHLHRWPIADEFFVKAAGHPLSASIGGQSLRATAEENGVRVGGLPADAPAGTAPWIVTVEFETAPTAFAAAPAKVIEFVAGESLFLSPLDAELNSVNGIVIPKINRFANGNVSVGSLHKVGDTLAWRALSPVEGEYEVLASLGAIKCQENAGFELSSGASVIRGRTWLTAHYSEPVRKSIGRLRLVKGENRIVLRVSEAPMEAFSDVHGITLIPVGPDAAN